MNWIKANSTRYNSEDINTIAVFIFEALDEVRVEKGKGLDGWEVASAQLRSTRA